LTKKNDNIRLFESFDVDVYEKKVFIGICSNSDELERWMNELMDHDNEHDDEYPCEALHFYDDPGNQWIIFVESAFTMNTCAHECFHLTHYMMKDIGFNFDISEQEPHAWLHGFLLDKVYNIAIGLKEKANQ